jgi:hypothetical protein
MRALETLVTQNVGFKLFREIERTKKRLTPDIMAPLTFRHEHIDIRERMLRRDFEAMIDPELIQVHTDVHRVLEEASLSPDDVDVVLRTGGTSLVPAYVSMLSDIFGRGKIREMDPLTSVVGGMAIVAHEDEGITPDYAYRYENPLRYIRVTSSRRYERTILRARMTCYTDRDYRIINLPLTLSGLYGVRSADLDYDSEAHRLLRFGLIRPSKVYIIYQAKAKQLPYWLRGFEREINLQVDIQTP